MDIVKPQTSQVMVSVFITAYNIAPFIGPAIESVLAQTFQDFEIIIADDYSTDATRQLVLDYSRRYPNKIKLVLGERNIGIAGNTNRALAKCAGVYLAKLDGDDWWYPQKLECQVAYMEQHPEVVLSYHDAEIFASETDQVISLVSEVVPRSARRTSLAGVEMLFTRFPGISASSLMFRASAVGATRYEERVRYVNDWLFDVEVVARGGLIGVVDGVLGRYRRHSRNITLTSGHNRTVLEENLLASALITSRYPQLTGLAHRRVRFMLLAEMIIAIQANDHARSQALLHALIVYGGALKGIFFWMAYTLGRKFIPQLKQRYPGLVRVLVRRIYG